MDEQDQTPVQAQDGANTPAPDLLAPAAPQGQADTGATDQAQGDAAAQPSEAQAVTDPSQGQAQAEASAPEQVPAQFASGGNAVEARFEQAAERLMTVVTEQVEQVLERLREEGVTLSPAKWAQAMNAFTGWCLSVEARLAALEGKKSQGQDQAQG